MYSYVFLVVTLVMFPPCNAHEDAMRPVQVTLMGMISGNVDEPNVLQPRPDPATSGPPGKRGPPGQPGPKGDQGPPGLMGNAESSGLGCKDEFDSLKAKIQQISNLVNEKSNQTYDELDEKLQQILDIVNSNSGQIIENIDTKIDKMSENFETVNDNFETVNDNFDAINEKLSALEKALQSSDDNKLTSLVTTTTAKDSTQTTTSTAGSFIAHCGLGLADGRVKDSQISASGAHDSNFPKTKARLNERSNAWMMRGGWIQFDFGKPVNISGIIIKGDASSAYWTTTFEVMHGVDAKELKYIEDHNGFAMFSGNRNNYEPRIVYFVPVLSARYLRIVPVAYKEYPSVRMEVLTPTDLQGEEGQNLPVGAVCTYKKIQFLSG